MLNTRDRISTQGAGNTALGTRTKVRAPRIRLVTPGTNFIVNGDVFILIDAFSDQESVGTLQVEVMIDGATTISANYSPASGFYGAIWDSSSTEAGSMHTLIARVTDSVGNSKSALRTVSVG